MRASPGGYSLPLLSLLPIHSVATVYSCTCCCEIVGGVGGGTNGFDDRKTPPGLLRGTASWSRHSAVAPAVDGPETTLKVLPGPAWH